MRLFSGIEGEDLRWSFCLKFFINFDLGKDKTFGQLLNHSSVHPNVEPKIYLSEWNKLDILFRAKRKIEEGEEIVWGLWE